MSFGIIGFFFNNLQPSTLNRQMKSTQTEANKPVTVFVLMKFS